MPIRTVFCALAFCAAFAQGATCVWTGGSGSWSDSANWLDGGVPAAGDTVYVSNTVANITIDIDVPGVSIASIRFEGQSDVTLTGETLTLTGGWSFKAYVPKETNVMDYRISTFPWLAYGANVECRVPLVFAPSGTSCGVCTATNIVHFREKVTIQGSGKTFYLHNGLQPTPEDTAAGVPPGSSTVPMYFHKEVVGESATLRPNQAPTGEVYFYDAVKVATLHDAGWNSSTMNLYSPSNSWNEMLVDYGNIIYARAQGAIPPNTVLKLNGGTQASNNGIFNLGNFDTTIDRIYDSDTGIAQYATATKGGIINSALSAEGTFKPYPATLTMKATGDGRTTMMVQRMVSIVWDPVDDYTFTFTNRTSATSGFIAVKRGTLRLTGNAAFPNVRDVSVDAGAKFSIESSAAAPVSPNAFLRLGTGAKLGLAAGVSAHMGAVMVDGQLVADGTYSGAGEGAVGWIEGDGEVVVDGTNIRVWKSAASGTWADSSNWAGGRVPDGAEKGVFVCNDSADDFTVTIASPIASFPTNFNVRNLGGGLTTISCAADVEAVRASMSVGEGARFKVEDGARFWHATIEPTAYSPISYNNKYSNLPCAVNIHDGGEWLTSGSTVFTNFYGAFVVKGRDDAASAFKMRGGEFLFCDLDSAWPINVYTNAAMDAQGGVFRLPHHGYNHDTDLKLWGGMSYFSNAVLTTEGKFPTPSGGSAVFGTGETVFDAGSAFQLATGYRYLRPSAAGQTAHLTLKSGATFDAMSETAFWAIGGIPGGRAVFDSYAKDTVKTRPFVVGDLAGEGVLNVKAGLLRVHSYGLRVANDSVHQTPAETNVVGRVTVEAGAAMDVAGSLDGGWGAWQKICGIAVGAGEGVSLSGRPFDGRMDVFGMVTNKSGNFVVGWGAAKGVYVQHGGASVLRQNAAYGFRAATVVGLGGGVGDLIVSNGAFKVLGGEMYVGGCPYDFMPCYSNKNPHGKMPWNPTSAPANNHDAEGKVMVVGGTFSAASNVVVGADGFGVIEMVGNAGAFTAGNLVLSNSTSSVVRFVAGPDGFSPIGVTGNLAVTDGARIEVDLSGYTGNGNVFRLFNFATFEGDLEDVELVLIEKDGVSRKSCRLKRTASAVDFAIVNGTRVILW